MKTFIFTMVKDEDDIIDDWVNYHGSMFGFENLYIIDNYSCDSTYEKLLNFNKKNIPINIIRKQDYSKKGDYMTELISNYANEDDFCFPIDIDEFIVFYDKDTNELSVDKNKIISYIYHLPDSKVYKTNYISVLITQPYGYQRAATECSYGIYSDYGNMAKSFIKKKLFDKKIDHGNHICTDEYFLTKLCLIHFHNRNLEQMKKKIYNNVLGLGYNVDSLESLKKNIMDNKDCPGNHHIKNQIKILENNYNLQYIHLQDSNKSKLINLYNFNNIIKNGFF